MILQMSTKSKIYHRNGCRYIDRIDPTKLDFIDATDRKIKSLNPCKCCCSIHTLYDEVKPELRDIFTDLDIAVELDGEEIKCHTGWYEWVVRFNSSTQEFRIYQCDANDIYPDSLTRVYPQDPTPLWHLETVMKLIANEEKIAIYPEPYRKQALQIEQYAKEQGVQIEYDGTDLYVLTDMAAWKIAYGYHFDWFKLLHCPFDGEKLSMEETKTAHYHVQGDVPRKQTPLKHLNYIVRHDIAKQIEKVDYRRLPQKTKKQKKYYRQAQYRATRESINRVWQLFGQLEAKGEISRLPAYAN